MKKKRREALVTEKRDQGNGHPVHVLDNLLESIDDFENIRRTLFMDDQSLLQHFKNDFENSSILGHIYIF